MSRPPQLTAKAARERVVQLEGEIAEIREALAREPDKRAGAELLRLAGLLDDKVEGLDEAVEALADLVSRREEFPDIVDDVRDFAVALEQLGGEPVIERLADACARLRLGHGERMPADLAGLLLRAFGI